MNVIEAPNNNTKGNIKIFLAGGISNCPDWQSIIIEKLNNEDNPYQQIMLEGVTVFNPRRKNYENVEDTIVEQITWEFFKLKESDIIAFWFSSGSLNPITLYEYGKHVTSTKLVVGVDVGYERKNDIKIQTSLIRPTQHICYDLDEFYNDIIKNIYDLSMSKNNLIPDKKINKKND